MDITSIENAVRSLPESDRKVFDRIFEVSSATGELVPPASMEPWIEKKFGSLDNVREQRIVRVFNKVTFEGGLYNSLRSMRPIEEKEGSREIREEIRTKENCPFCDPLRCTPEDTFGRVDGKYCVSASNIAKYDYIHGLVIFKEHDPLVLDREKIDDYSETSERWFKAAHEQYPDAIYPFLMYNCLWRSGASVAHGHFQLTLTKWIYPKIFLLKTRASEYAKRYDSKYFDDLFRAHESLGLGIEAGTTKIMAYLSPVKKKEFYIVSKENDDDFRSAIHKVLSFYEGLNEQSFNMAIMRYPLNGKEDWKDFPYICRIVTRGNLESKVCDIGAMELYTSSVISADPFKLMERFKGSI